MRRTLFFYILLILFAISFATTNAEPGKQLLMALNQDSKDVSFIDMTTNTEVKRLYVDEPQYGVMTEDYAYIASVVAFGQQKVYKINLTSFAKEKEIAFTIDQRLVEFEVSPDEKWVIAVDRYKATAYFLRTEDLSIAKVIRLCRTCGNPWVPLWSIPVAAFSPDSKFVYIADDVEKKVTIINLTSQKVLTTLPALNSGSPYEDLVMHPRNKDLYYLSSSREPNNIHHIREYNMKKRTYRDLFISAQDGSGDIEVLPQGYIVAGSVAYGANDVDVVKVYDLNTDQLIEMNASEASYTLEYNPRTNELWSICLYGFTDEHCDPFVIDIFDMNTLQKIKNITGPTTLTRGIPTFSPNFIYYYVPLKNTTLVINAMTKNIEGEIPVGEDPRSLHTIVNKPLELFS